MVQCFIRRSLNDYISWQPIPTSLLLASRLLQKVSTNQTTLVLRHKIYLTHRQNEMKFISLFAFVSTVSAGPLMIQLFRATVSTTTVQFSSDAECNTFVGHAYSKCVICNPIAGTHANITHGKGVVFWGTSNCTGSQSQVVQENQCYSLSNLTFTPGCFKIVCWNLKVSCLIGVLLFFWWENASILYGTIY